MKKKPLFHYLGLTSIETSHTLMKLIFIFLSNVEKIETLSENNTTVQTKVGKHQINIKLVQKHQPQNNCI